MRAETWRRAASLAVGVSAVVACGSSDERPTPTTLAETPVDCVIFAYLKEKDLIG